MALRRHVDLFVGRPPGRDWKRRPGWRPALVVSIKFGGTRTLHHWNSEGMPFCRKTWSLMLERRNDPRWLRDHDDIMHYADCLSS